jgi:NAD-dependent DNA ligase
MSFKNILTQVLEKLNKKYEELTPDEKATFDNWEKVLSAGPVTIEKVVEFLKMEIKKNTEILTNMDVKLKSEKDLWLKMAISRDKLLIEFIQSPEEAAKKLENYLRTLHKITG